VAVVAAVPAPVDAGPPLAVVEDRFHRFVLGLPDSVNEEISSIEQATLRRLEAIGERFDVSGLPRLPSVLPQLLRALKNDNLAGNQLAAMIGRDPVLVGEVMRVAGSAHFRTAQPIHSLQHAVVLLGRDSLRQVATLHVMKPILQASAGMRGHSAGPWLWEHAERCAHAAAFLGRHGGCDPFESFLAGMVCHTGTGAIVRLLDQEAPPSLGAFSPAFLAGCMRIGARLSLRAVRHWEMPANVVVALTERVDAPDAPASPLGKALACADALAMVQLLVERGWLGADLDYSGTWPDHLPAPVLLRGQRDLHRQFAPAPD
jgi:HD-like signal output (HDOD) protein